MRKLAMIFAATSLMVCAAAYGSSDPLPSAPGNDKLEAARMAEVKGDRARIDNDYNQAIYNYITALGITPQNAVLYDKIGIAQLQLGDRRLARRYFQQALKYDPNYVAAMNNMGAVALMDKKYKTAINYLKKALALDETRASTHVNLAEAWVGEHKLDRAIKEYERALELDGDVLTNSQDGFQAQVTSPEERAMVSYLIARSYALRGNLEGALDYLSRAKDGFYPKLSNVYTDKAFAALWQDPRLQKIVKR